MEIKRPYTEHDIIESSPDILESSPDRKETSNESTSDDQDQQSISEDNSDNVSMDSALFEDQVFFDNSDTFDESALGDSEKLYPGSELTVIKCLALLFSWFCSSNVSKDSFSNLLHVLRNSILPYGNKLPSSYTEAYSIIKQLIVPVKQFDSCVNDCVVFKQCLEGSFENLTVCPKCSEPRFKKESSIPRKVFKYIPLAPRLNNSSDHLSEVSGIHQSKAWRARYDVSGPFCGDSRGISLTLCTDGMNPFSKEKVSYSMWPITLTVLKFPQALRMRNLPGSMLLAGIIPGKKEPKNLDPYMDVLVDELIELNGSQFFDGFRQEYFKLKIDILLHVLDYPGQNKLFHCQGMFKHKS